MGAGFWYLRTTRASCKRLEQSIAEYPALPPHGFDGLNYQRLLLVMTKWQLGRQDEARWLFAETKSAVDKEIQAPTTLWGRCLMLELLRREAGALIEPKKANEAVESESTNDE